MKRRLTLALALTGAVALAAAPAAGAPQRKTVKVGDYYLSPTSLTVNKGSTISFRWLPENADSHDVKLDRGPKGVRKWTSEISTTDYTYKRTLKVPGRYRVICTLHPDTMVTNITVRKR